jgi:hypothetical protein
MRRGDLRDPAILGALRRRSVDPSLRGLSEVFDACRRGAERGGLDGSGGEIVEASQVPNESPELGSALRARIDWVCEEGRAYWHRFDSQVRQNHWHPFVAADYDCVRTALQSLYVPGRRFLEWGSATGVITIVADLMGYDAYGIELDSSLVRVARDLAARAGSDARFAVGSFIPMGWKWRPRNADGRTGTIGHGRSGYLELGRPLSDFDIVYAFPWSGEESMLLDLFRCHGHEDACLLLHSSERGTRTYGRGSVEPVAL